MDAHHERHRSNVAGVGRAGFIRDPSGLLMSVIRTLASSDDGRQREQEKQRLEEAYAENDEKLDQMVAANYEELAKTIKQFGKIGERIADSRIRVKQVKESLLQCKSLLHCRQDELRKLWIQGLEHKKTLQLLDAVEDVKAAPENIERFMKQKRYLHGTLLIIKMLNYLTKDLIKVEALNDIRNELLSRKVHMHEGFINELHKQIYFHSSNGKDFDSVDKYSFDDLENFEDLNEDPEKNPFKLMAILVICIGLLQKIPEALESTKVKMDRHINMIVTHTTVEISDLYYKQSNQDDPKRLLQLLERLFTKFRCIVRAHEHVLNLLSHPVNRAKDGTEYQLYDMEEVWSKIQSVLQLLLQEYLDYDNSAAISQQVSSNFGENSHSLSSHFTRKRNTRPRVAKLFRFEGSSHAISMNTYLREQRAEQRINAGNKEVATHDFVDHNVTTQKVCKPNSRNITYIFGPLNVFIAEIEKAMKYSDDKKCLLNDFINDYIKNVFIRQMQYEMKKGFDAASKVTDPLRALTDVSDNKELDAPCQSLLQSAIVVDKCMWELQTLMTNLGGYHDQFLAMACSLLHEYKETLKQSYRSVVQPEEDRSIISASWPRDNAVNGFLRSLENWSLTQQELAAGDLQKKYSKQLLKDFHKEAQYFVARLGNNIISHGGYIEDINDMVAIANLHESLEWFAKRLKLLLSQINPCTPEDTQNQLCILHREYSTMSELCLICLHIEIRVHCFLHLTEMCKNCSYDIRSGDNMERDHQVIKLSNFITELDKLFQPVLQFKKLRYIFEGLGHMISSILINGAKFIPRITHHGIKRMCRNIFAMQQSITHATKSRESHLDSARLFYELLYNYPDDIQNIVVEQGVQFEECEYVIGIDLLHRSRPGSGSDSTKLARVQRLREIIREQMHKTEIAEKKALKEQEELN